MDLIYLDNNATTEVDSAVLEEMIPYFSNKFGNSSSSHLYGQEAYSAIEAARKFLATTLNARHNEVIFTSGTTESINIALRGICYANKVKGNHIITQVTEHKAVLETCGDLEKSGWKVTYLPVDKEGFIDLSMLSDSMNEKTVLVSIMHGNNEIGTLQPIDKIGEIVKQSSAYFFVDAAQTFGRIPIDVDKSNIDLLAASAHKIYGPKGVGLLYIRSQSPHVNISPIQTGGGHEKGLRSGTLPTPLIIGFAKAIEIALRDLEENQRLHELRELLINELKKIYPKLLINGSLNKRTPHNINLCFPGKDASVLIGKMKSVALSAGSACTSGSIEQSHVLLAIGDYERAKSSIRIGLGKSTTRDKIVDVIEKFSEVL